MIVQIIIIIVNKILNTYVMTIYELEERKEFDRLSGVSRIHFTGVF